MVNISININTTNHYLSSQIMEHNRDFDICGVKSFNGSQLSSPNNGVPNDNKDINKETLHIFTYTQNNSTSLQKWTPK